MKGLDLPLSDMRRRRCFVLAVPIMAAVLVTALPAWNQTAPAVNPATDRSTWSHLKFAIYFTSTDIEKLLVDPAARRNTLNYFRPVRPQRFYLEARSDRDLDVAMMKSVADAVRAAGIKVSGAMVPVVSHGPNCYNDSEQLGALERRSRAMAGIFDEVILDDWLFTTCTGESNVAARGSESWAEYRTQLLLNVARTHIIAPAKQVNPNIRMIIKYPNWYEGHRLNGYDVDAETRTFDAMAVGIETRTRAIHDQHIPIYSGYMFQKWWSGVDPGKWIGSWLDNYDMQGQPNDYIAQVWQAVLAQTPEIILWCAGTLHSSNPVSDVYPQFVRMLPEFDRVAGLLQGAGRGVSIYLPYGAVGEYNIFGYLGMAGIPLSPVAEFPADTQTAIFTRHSLRDPGLADKLLARLRAGRDVFMTWGLFRDLQQTEFKNALTLVDAGGPSVSSSQFRVRGPRGYEMVKADRPFVFPAIATTTWPYVRDVAAVREDYDFAVLMDVKYLKGSLRILNMPENAYDLLRLPPPLLNQLRSAFSGQLGVQLKGPGGVGFYPFGEKQYVLYNMDDKTAMVALHFEQALPTVGWLERAHGKPLSATAVRNPDQPAATEVSLHLQPFEIVVVQAP